MQGTRPREVQVKGLEVKYNALLPRGDVRDRGVVQERRGQEGRECQGSQHLCAEAEDVIGSEDSCLQRSRGEEIIDGFF